MKKIAVVNDLSGMGKCSLTAAIPVISVMGVQACPLPTAILSAQTGFPSYFYEDYTDRMERITQEWKKMDFRPDGIYTGFLAGAEQADRVLDFIELFGGDGTAKILVDPVMGDNGGEYPIYTEALCEKMRILASKAAIITPNLTEALLLLYGREEACARWAELENSQDIRGIIQKIGSQLAERFQVEIVITGIDLPAGDRGDCQQENEQQNLAAGQIWHCQEEYARQNEISGQTWNCQQENEQQNGARWTRNCSEGNKGQNEGLGQTWNCLEKNEKQDVSTEQTVNCQQKNSQQKECGGEHDLPQQASCTEPTIQIANLIITPSKTTWITAPKQGGSYSGTGDLFASVLAAGMVKGTDTAASVQKAVCFLGKALQDTVREGTDRNEGVCFESHLGELL